MTDLVSHVKYTMFRFLTKFPLSSKLMCENVWEQNTQSILQHREVLLVLRGQTFLSASKTMTDFKVWLFSNRHNWSLAKFWESDPQQGSGPLPVIKLEGHTR